MKESVNYPLLIAISLLILTLTTVENQRRVIGDINEQSISQLADFDAREERVFRYMQDLFNYVWFESIL